MNTTGEKQYFVASFCRLSVFVGKSVRQNYLRPQFPYSLIASYLESSTLRNVSHTLVGSIGFTSQT
jgi:hypothetical protein